MHPDAQGVGTCAGEPLKAARAEQTGPVGRDKKAGACPHRTRRRVAERLDRKAMPFRLLGPPCAALTASFAPSAAWSQDPTPREASVEDVLGGGGFSPSMGRTFPIRPLWGDTHRHTIVSVYAGTTTWMTHEEAFRFARGEELTTTQGLRAKLARPLDWLVISDQAEIYGLMPQLLSRDLAILATDRGPTRDDALTSGDSQVAFARAMQIMASLSDEEPPIDPPCNQTCLGELCGSGRPLERPRHRHQNHRLRIDDRGRQQPAPQRAVPRRRNPREPHPTVLAI